MTNNTDRITLVVNKNTDTDVAKCIVHMDNTVSIYNDFVTVGYDESTGKTHMLSNTDELTLGKAVELIGSTFRERFAALSEDDRLAVKKELGLC